MKRIIILLSFILLFSMLLFAKAETPSDSYGSLSLALDIGKGELDTNLLNAKYEEYYALLSFDGASFFNQGKRNLFGLGYSLAFIIPQEFRVKGKEEGMAIPFGGFGKVTFEYSPSLTNSLFLDLRLGVGAKYLLINRFTIKDYVKDQDIENIELFLTSGLGLRYEFKNNVGLRFGLNFNYSFFSHLKSEFRYNVEEGDDKVKSMVSYSFEPYIGVAFLY